MLTTTETAVFAADRRSRLTADAAEHRAARHPRQLPSTPRRGFGGRLVRFTRPAAKGAC